MSLLTATTASAQRSAFRTGYVVLTNAPTDTLRGLVALRHLNQRHPYAELHRAGRPVGTFQLPELLAVGYDTGEQYRRLALPAGSAPADVLLHVLVAGPTSLYMTPASPRPAAYYLQKPGQPLVLIPRKSIGPVLQAAFADCPTAATTVAYGGTYRYAPADLSRYVANYNRCRQADAPVRTLPVAPVKEHLHWGVQAGLARPNIYYPYTIVRRTSPGHLRPTISAGVALPLNHYLAVVGSLGGSSVSSDNTIVQPTANPNYLQTAHYHTRGTILRGSISLRGLLRRPDARWRPYLQAGGHLSHIVGARLDWQTWYEDPNAPFTPQSFPIALNGAGRGLQGEAGLLLRSRPGLLSLSLRYEQTYGFAVPGRSFRTDLNQLSLLLGYAY